MAYTRVTATRSGSKAIDYAIDDKENHKEGDMDRVLMKGGWNVDTDKAKEQMESVWKAFNKDKGDYRQLYRMIQSFRLSDLDPNNPDDIIKANEIGVETASILYPDRQALVVTQADGKGADGKGGKIHNHILVNSVSFVDGRSLNNENYIRNMNGEDVQVYSKELGDIRMISDQVIQKYGIEPIIPDVDKNMEDRRTQIELKMAESGRYVWKDDLKARISSCLADTDVIDRDRFIESMRDDYDITVNYRGKKTLSYEFLDLDTDMKRPKKPTRGKRLGSDYDIETLDKTFMKNVELQNKEEESYFEFDMDAELNKIRGDGSAKEPRQKTPSQEKEQLEEKTDNTKKEEFNLEDMFDNMMLSEGIKPVERTSTEDYESLEEVEDPELIEVEDNKEDIKRQQIEEQKRKDAEMERERQALKQQEQQRILDEMKIESELEKQKEVLDDKKIISTYVEPSAELIEKYRSAKSDLEQDRDSTTQQAVQEHTAPPVVDDGPDM